MLFFDEPLVSIVRDTFEGYAMGRFATQTEIQRFFETFPDFPRNKKGEFTRQRVKDVLINPLYTGYICSENYGIDWLKGHHDSLISVETFEKVQERLQGIAKAPHRKRIALRGFVCCADCGTPLRSSYSTGRSKSYAYYLTCDSYGKSIARDKVEGDVGAMIKTLQPTRQLVALAKAMFRHAWDQRRAQAQEAIKTGRVALRRTVLKLAFADRIQYDRFEGPRTPQIVLPFRALGGLADPGGCFGAGGGTRTHTGTRPNRF